MSTDRKARMSTDFMENGYGYGEGYEARPPARATTTSGGQVSVTSAGYVGTTTVTD